MPVGRRSVVDRSQVRMCTGTLRSHAPVRWLPYQRVAGGAKWENLGNNYQLVCITIKLSMTRIIMCPHLNVLARSLLRSPDVQRDPKRYLQAVQKVIACMTLGIDVSKLFSEMIMVHIVINTYSTIACMYI